MATGALADPPVGATGESQGRDRRQRDSDAAHKLHGVLPPYVPAAPSLGDTGELSGDPHRGDKPAHRATAYALYAICPPSNRSENDA